MTEPVQVPETATEIAKRLWDSAIQHLEYAADAKVVEASDSYVRIGELALRAAQFALTNQALVSGILAPEYGLPPGAPPLPAHIAGPVGGPRVWGTTK